MGIIIRQTIKGSIANYLGIAIGFVTTFFVLTDCLNASEIGLTRIMVDAAILFSSLAMLGTSSSAVKFYPYFKEEDGSNHGFFGWAFLLTFTGFLAFLVLFLLCKDRIIGLYSERSPLLTQYVYYLIPLTFFALYTSVFEASANVLMRIAVPKFVREVGIRLCNLASYLLYGYGVIDFDLFVLFFCSSYALAAIVDFIYLLSLGRVSFRLDFHFMNRKLAKEIFAYTLLVTVVAITSNVQLFNSLFLGAQGGLAMAGIYTIAQYIANVVGVPSRSLMAISNPVISQTIKDGDLPTLNQLTRKVSLHQLLASLFIYFFICINLDALYAVIPNGAEYAGGFGVVLLLGMNNIIIQTCSPAVSVLNFSRRYAYSLPFSLVMTATAIALNIKLIPLIGVNGAATATLGATALYYLIMLAFVGKGLKVNLFTWQHLKTIGMFALLLAVNMAWHWLLTPKMPHVLADAALRSLTLLILAMWLTYKMKLSDDVNAMINKYITKLLHLR